MREVLRMSPSAPLRVVAPTEDTTLKGKYAVEKDVSIIVNISQAHRDPKVWGPDADKFRPERMLDGKFEALPPNAWQPFGYGMRGCIGRPFAWQEVQMVLVALLQSFDLVPQDPAYELQIKQTLTIKPKGFHIRAIPRSGKPQLLAVPSALTLKASTETGKASAAGAAVQGQGLQPLYVLYGSNTGSSESFAQRIATDAASHGFRPTLGTLDSAVEHIPTDGPVFIVTASFEGQPADNAAHFVEWLSNLSGSELSNVKYGVFGCGNHDWVATYQRIPKLIDEALAQRGAIRLVEHGEGDAGAADFFDSFDAWETNLWPVLAKEYSTQKTEQTSGLSVKTVYSGPNRAEVLRQADTALGTVVETRLLTSPNAPAKRHLEFELPEGTTFRAGDYLAILPINPPRDVRRAVARFGLLDDQEVEISSAGPSSLPTGKPITLSALFSGYVELSQPATTRDLRLLTDIAKNDPDALKGLQELSSAYVEKVVEKRLSVLDILEDYPSVHISLDQFLQLLPSMRVRQYSISSSPLYNPTHVTVTVSIIEAPARSGRDEPFQGVSSTYLASLRPGDKVNMAVRASNVAFHPPADPTVPLVMFCAGSGLAPMRGFLQERALQKQAGREVTKSLLFFGCRAPGEDYLYSDSDLKEWAELGIVDLRPAFSRANSESEGCKYVQDRIWHDRLEVSKAFLEGGKFYLCGSAKIATEVKKKLIAIIQEARNIDEEAATVAFAKTLNGRFATDVFE